MGQQGETKVPPGDATVGGGVRSEFGDDLFGSVDNSAGQVPGAQPLGREEAGEAGAAWRGGQEHPEVVCGGKKLGGLFLVHVTERGCECLP